MTTITVEQLEAEEAQSRISESHGQCLSIVQAAAILHLHRDSLREMTTKKGLGHRAPRHTGRTAPWHLTIDDLETAYPHLKRKHRPKLTNPQPVTNSEHQQAFGPDVIRPGSARHEQIKRRRRNQP